MVMVKHLRAVRLLNGQMEEIDAYLTLHQCHHHLSSALNIDHDLLGSGFKQQIVVVFSICEDEALLAPLESLLLQKCPVGQRRNIAMHLLRKEIVECKIW